MNPSSLAELSLQVRMTWLVETTTASRTLGSVGTVPMGGVGVAVGSPAVGDRVGVRVGVGVAVDPGVDVRVGVAVAVNPGVDVRVGVEVGVEARVVAKAVFDQEVPALL